MYELNLDVKSMIKSYEKELKKISLFNNNEIKKTVIVKKIRGKYRYYLYHGKGKVKYLKNSEISIARDCVLHDYAKKTAKCFRSRISALKNIKSVFEENNPYDIYDKLYEGKKLLIHPFFETEEEFVKKWRENHISNGLRIDANLIAKSGHFVRSKSEMIIDDALFDSGLVYAYEAPLMLEDGREWHPDFQILDVKNRRTIIWEHFGKMDDLEYTSSVLYKYNYFIQNGFLPGETLIWTREFDNTFERADVNKNISWLKNGGDWGYHELVNSRVS